MDKKDTGTPSLLRAIELILSNPKDVKHEAQSLKNKYFKKYSSTKTEDEIINKVINKIISNYSYYTAFVGGATSMTSIIPGLGTVLSMFGGTTADMALTMKYQIEMVMAIAAVCDHNIVEEEEKRICFIVAGLGAINEAGKRAGETIGTKAFSSIIEKSLKSSTVQATKEIFKKVGITFTQKAVEKSIPLGVGVVIGFSANKSMTYYIGRKAKGFFLTD